MSGICGLASFSGLPASGSVLRDLAEAASYRGPDGIAFRVAGEAGLAHLALHATPTSRFKEQPLHRQGVWLVADVRLDNRHELLQVLAGDDGLRDGPASSDAEILLAAWLHWGTACAERLLGDFAFALWDTRTRTLFCAVDPLGVKPLHYARAAGLLVFASDALQVLAHPAISGELDLVTIGSYLAGRREDPRRSFFQDVHRLPAGHRLTATAAGDRVERYWDPQPAPILYRRDEDYAESFRELFQRAVQDRLSLPPAGRAAVAMSGGLDSCSVAAAAQRSLSAGGSPGLLAGSFVFPGLAECDEGIYIDAMDRELGLDVENVDAERAWDLQGCLARPLGPDTPFTSWDAGYGEMLGRLAARKARVLLTGHGGDDLLRGSALVYADRLRRGDWSAVTDVARFARERSEPLFRSLYRYLGRPLLPQSLNRRQPSFPDWLLPGFLRRAGLAERPARTSWPSAKREIYENTAGTAWYDRAVHWHDRNAARFGMEARHPFLDRRLFEYVLAIPPEQIYQLGVYKPLLRRATVGLLPETVRTRRTKTRFVAFLDVVMREREAERIEAMLSAPVSAELGMVDPARLLQAFRDYRAGAAESRRSFLWYAVNLEIWLRRLRGRGAREAAAA
jgi:asparagine synthase (glutamine-hydrolysing)